ncbi:methyltransferase [Nonomuraea sp. NPDC048881]|uniref:methyltransferase n=1 Tax=Nonomuraea sp. NPDC048881 TaxID=3155030 RepID=UPI0033DB9571
MSCKPRVTYSTPSSPPRPSPSPRRPPPPPDDPPGPVEAGRPASVRLRTSANCSAWGSVGRKLEASPGVHRPSTFSAFLASTLDDTRDQVVLDAGCGAGLVTLAALTAGARHVIAQDHDGAALADTARNVIPFLGHEARKRLTLWEADWRLLAPMSADLLAVNPPQRPTTGPHHRGSRPRSNRIATPELDRTPAHWHPHPPRPLARCAWPQSGWRPAAGSAYGAGLAKAIARCPRWRS